MVEHCRTCNCEPVKICGIERSYCVGLLLLAVFFSFFGLGVLMLMYIRENQHSGWRSIDIYIYKALLSIFGTSSICAFLLHTYLFLFCMWSIICGIYAYFCDFLVFVRDHAITPIWQCVRVMYSGNTAATQPHRVVSGSSDSDEEKPPLPPKSRNVLAAAAAAAESRHQDITADVECRASTSATSSDSSPSGADSQSMNFEFPRRQPESSHRRKEFKYRSRKERLRERIDQAIQLKAIQESDESSSRQDLSRLEIPLSVLLNKPESTGYPMAQETSFCDSGAAAAAEQPMVSKRAEFQGWQERREQTLDAGFSGMQRQVEFSNATGARKKQKSPGRTSSYVRVSGTEKPKAPSGIKKTKANQMSAEQRSSAGYMGISELQSQAREFREFQRLQSEGQSLAATGFSALSKQIEASDMQKEHENQEQTSATGFFKSERQVRESRTQELQNMQTSRDQVTSGEFSGASKQAQTSGSKDVIKKPQSYIQTSLLGFPGFSALQKQSPASEAQRRQNLQEKRTEVRFEGLEGQASASNIQMEQMRSERASTGEFSGLTGQLHRSAASGIQKSPEKQEQTSRAAYAGFPSLERGSVTKDIQGREKTRQTFAAGTSGLERTARAHEILRKQKNEALSGAGQASSSLLTPGIQRVSTKETEMNDPSGKTEARGQSVPRSSDDSSRPRLEGATGQDNRQTENFLSLNLTGGHLIVSGPRDGVEARKATSSETYPGGFQFIFDQPINVLDLSHIEVRIPPPEHDTETEEDDD